MREAWVEAIPENGQQTKQRDQWRSNVIAQQQKGFVFGFNDTQAAKEHN